MNDKCIECEWYNPSINGLCTYCYKKSQVIISGNEIAEVCRKCDRGYKYTDEEIEEGEIGEDICRDCVTMRRTMRGMNFSKDDLRFLLKTYPPY
jgi:hypothetical protein